MRRHQPNGQTHRAIAILWFALLLVAPSSIAAPDAADRAVLTKLNKAATVDPGQLTLSESIDAIAGQARVEADVDWAALELVGISKDSLLWLNLKAVPAEQVLRFALDQVSADAFDDDKAGFAVRDGKVTVSTRRQLKVFTENQDYSIRKYMAAARGGVTAQEIADMFVELINTNVGDQDEWLDEESTITEQNGKLKIKTTPENHAAIAELFDQIDRPVDNARDLENKLDRATETRLKRPYSHKQENAPFSDVIASLREGTGLNIAVNWLSLELVGVERDSVVGIEPKRMPAGEFLQALLDHVSADAFDDDKAGYLVHDGVVYIDTLRMLKSRTETQVYKLSRWMGNKAGDEEAVQQVIEAIHDNVGDPDDWLDEAYTTLNLHGLLVVKTTRAHHHKIVELLGRLRR